MKKIVAILILISSFWLTSCERFGKNSSAHKNLVKQAKSMTEAYEDADYDMILRYYNEDIIALLGGKDITRKLLMQERAAMEQKGISFKNIEITDYGSIADTAEQLQSVLEETITYENVNGDDEKQLYTIIAISKDNGENWKFADATDASAAEINAVIPALSTDIRKQLKK